MSVAFTVPTVFVVLVLCALVCVAWYFLCRPLWRRVDRWLEKRSERLQADMWGDGSEQ